MAVLKVMNHSEYIKKTKKMSIDSLKFVIADCKTVIDAQSSFNPNCGYYADEICYCGMELKRRENKLMGVK